MQFNHRRARQVLLALVALMFVAGMAPSAFAQSYLVFNTGVYHFKNQDERNMFTPGIGWEYSPSKKVGFHLGTLSDSFGYQATYAGVNWATPAVELGKLRMRFIVGASVVKKQFHKNTEAETRILPLPVLEVGLSKRSVLNISGSPELDFQGSHNNALIFFQYKLGIL